MVAYGLKRFESYNKPYRDVQGCKESGASSSYTKIKSKNR